MLKEYIHMAMSKAVYEKLEDGTFAGKIFECPAVAAFGSLLYDCQGELRVSLEGWLIVTLRHGDEIPTIEGIDLNQKGLTNSLGLLGGYQQLLR